MSSNIEAILLFYVFSLLNMLNEWIPLHTNKYKYDFGNLKIFMTMIHSKNTFYIEM